MFNVKFTDENDTSLCLYKFNNKYFVRMYNPSLKKYTIIRLNKGCVSMFYNFMKTLAKKDL